MRINYDIMTEPFRVIKYLTSDGALRFNKTYSKIDIILPEYPSSTDATKYMLIAPYVRVKLYGIYNNNNYYGYIEKLFGIYANSSDSFVTSFDYKGTFTECIGATYGGFTIGEAYINTTDHTVRIPIEYVGYNWAATDPSKTNTCHIVVEGYGTAKDTRQVLNNMRFSEIYDTSATTRTYRLAGSTNLMPLMKSVDYTASLDTFEETGIYPFGAAPTDTDTRPVNRSGFLEVINATGSNSFILQRYTPYDGLNGIFMRAKISSGWTAWRKLRGNDYYSIATSGYLQNSWAQNGACMMLLDNDRETVHLQICINKGTAVHCLTLPSVLRPQGNKIIVPAINYSTHTAGYAQIATNGQVTLESTLVRGGGADSIVFSAIYKNNI